MYRRLHGLTVGVEAAVLCLALAAPAVAQRGRVQGRVTDAYDNPIEGGDGHRRVQHRHRVVDGDHER